MSARQFQAFRAEHVAQLRHGVLEHPARLGLVGTKLDRRLRAVEQEHVAVQDGSEATPSAQLNEKNKQDEDETEAFRHSAAVKAIGAKLGLNPEQAATAFTVGNFVVLAILVGWFLLKTLPKTFRDRNSAIQKNLIEARAATEDAGARLNSVEARLSKLDEQIAAMRAQAEQFLRFVSDPRNQAQLPPRIPYGVTNRGATELIDRAVLPNLPTAPDNFRTALFINDRYWLENIDRLNQRFNAWVSR